MRHILLAALIVAAAAFVAATVSAQAVGPPRGGSYGSQYNGGNGPGYGGGYGMMGGSGYGMMGGAGYSGTNAGELSLDQAMRLLEPSGAKPAVDRAHEAVTFTGTHVRLSLAAVQPDFPDTTFEIAGLVDPTVVIPAGATVTLTLVNMDYGQNMDHGVEITSVAPPYPVLGMMGMRDVIAGVPILPPRSGQDRKDARYAVASTTFQAPPPGVYYYLCQYSDHAAKGMYGKLIVRSN